MKKLIPTVIAAVLTLGISIGCKPSSVPAKSKGHSLGSAANEANTEALIQIFKRNGFEMIAGKTLDQILPADISSDAFVGMVALRDTTVKPPNEFVVGVGSDTVLWFESHDVSGDAIADWKAHLAKQTNLVKKLAASKQDMHSRQVKARIPDSTGD
jgi:hypothetical protein